MNVCVGVDVGVCACMKLKEEEEMGQERVLIELNLLCVYASVYELRLLLDCHG